MGLDADLRSGLDLADLLGTPHGVFVEGELVFSDDGATILVAHVRHHVQVRRPKLKLALPVDDGGQRSGDQKWA